MYKTVAELETDKTQLKEKYEQEAPSCEGKKNLWNDFEKRFVQHTERLARREARDTSGQGRGGIQLKGRGGLLAALNKKH